MHLPQTLLLDFESVVKFFEGDTFGKHESATNILSGSYRRGGGGGGNRQASSSHNQICFWVLYLIVSDCLYLSSQV